MNFYGIERGQTRDEVFLALYNATPDVAPLMKSLYTHRDFIMSGDGRHFPIMFLSFEHRHPGRNIITRFKLRFDLTVKPAPSVTQLMTFADANGEHEKVWPSPATPANSAADVLLLEEDLIISEFGNIKEA